MRPNVNRSKREVYGWGGTGETGEFRYLDKHLLRIDKRYQRPESKAKIAKIAKEFNWAAFGVLLVAYRDHAYYVYDGQHRVDASKRRDDVQELPCLVFVFDELSKEAQAFVDANTVRGPVRALDRFRARLEAQDSDALAIQGILNSNNYEVAIHHGSHNKNHIACIDAVERVYQRGRDHCHRVIETARELYGGNTPKDKMIGALSLLDQHLQRKHGDDLSRRDIREKLCLCGPETLMRRITGMAEALGKSGEKVWAAALVQEINKGKRGKRIEPIFGD